MASIFIFIYKQKKHTSIFCASLISFSLLIGCEKSVAYTVTKPCWLNNCRIQILRPRKVKSFPCKIFPSFRNYAIFLHWPFNKNLDREMILSFFVLLNWYQILIHYINFTYFWLIFDWSYPFLQKTLLFYLPQRHVLSLYNLSQIIEEFWITITMKLKAWQKNILNIF